MVHRLAFVLSTSTLLFASALAIADVPPPDACSTVGETCDSAGPNGDQPGTCTASKCRRASPTGPVEYDCSRCVAGGAAPSKAAATNEPKPKTAPTPAPQVPASADADDGDDCSIGHGSTTPPTAWLVALLGLIAVRRIRRS